MSEFVMPSLGADMTSGKLMQWLVAQGDSVNHGDIVAVVETDKGAIDVEIFQDGVIQQLLVNEGTQVAVGTALALLNGGAAQPTLPNVETAAPEATPTPRSTAQPPVSPPLVSKPVSIPVIPPQASARIHASPLARRRAAELGLDLALVRGTRPGGAIAVVDVERAAIARPAPSAPAVAPPDSTSPVPPPQPTDSTDRNQAMRRAIAASMAKANREIPHYFLATDINMKRSLDWLTETNAGRPVADRLIYAALLLKAVARAIDRVPEMNGFYTENGFEGSNAIHTGVAISLRQGGLVAPAIHDVDTLSLDEIMAALRDLITRARSGKLRSSEVMDPTITITNIGEQGVPTIFGVIYPPQVSLVGFGKIVDRPWVVDGMIGIRPIMTATLSGDHRASDGHRGGIFLAEIDRLLQEPEKL